MLAVCRVSLMVKKIDRLCPLGFCILVEETNHRQIISAIKKIKQIQRLEMKTGITSGVERPLYITNGALCLTPGWLLIYLNII